jgi:murein DD-endopeptidase MepM/ murein hydrolase activator NlpD
LNRHAPAPEGPRQFSGHVGVDFAACSNRKIVSVGAGIVAFIHEDTISDPSFYTGNSVTVAHYLQGSEGALVMFEYVHLINIRVKVGERIGRETVIGDAWSTPDQRGWIPHVHLMLLESSLPFEKRSAAVSQRMSLASTPHGPCFSNTVLVNRRRSDQVSRQRTANVLRRCGRSCGTVPIQRLPTRCEVRGFPSSLRSWPRDLPSRAADSGVMQTPKPSSHTCAVEPALRDA